MKHIGKHNFPEYPPTYSTLDDGLFPTHVATTDPTVTDDEDSFYVIGHRWFRTDTLEIFICSDVTVGAAVWTSLDRIPHVEETGASRNVAIADLYTVIDVNNASARTITIEEVAVINCPIGSWFGLRQKGAGTVTLAVDASVTAQSRGSLMDTNGQFALMICMHVASNVWSITGDRA